jgi:opacity protein-like surface antigen
LRGGREPVGSQHVVKKRYGIRPALPRPLARLRIVAVRRPLHRIYCLRDWADASGFGTFTNTSTSGLCAGGCLTNNTWLATVRGRVGYALDRFLVYGTAGAAFGDVRASFSNDPASSVTKTGWIAGAGIELALDRNWSAKAEYLFVDLGNGSCTAACAIVNPNGPPLIPDVSVRFDESLVRAGIDYRFHS